MANFWEQKPLGEMNREEWESLCDHCGKCCLLKLQDEDSASDDAGSVYYTNIVCDLFYQNSGHCSDYYNRETLVPSCLRLTPDNLEAIAWMPLSCAYRRIMEGRGLADWHHLVSGDKQTIHTTGNSVLGKVVQEKQLKQTNDSEIHYEEYIVQWPLDCED